MALKKSQLYSSLWSSCDELRGGMDASQYKDYILTLLFMKYVSDKYAGTSDDVMIVAKGGSFADMIDVKGDKEIGSSVPLISAITLCAWISGPTTFGTDKVIRTCFPFAISRAIRSASSRASNT